MRRLAGSVSAADGLDITHLRKGASWPDRDPIPRVAGGCPATGRQAEAYGASAVVGGRVRFVDADDGGDDAGLPKHELHGQRLELDAILPGQCPQRVEPGDSLW